MKITGIKYWRRKKRFTRKELSKRAAVSENFITNAEKEISPQTVFSTYIKLANALSVPLDDLLKEYDDSQLDYCDHATYLFKKKRPPENANCIAKYRIDENLTYQQLSEILGITSREGARKICNSSCPSSKHLKTVAAREGISVEEFLFRYTPERSAAA